MSFQQPSPLTDGVGRIWAHISANASHIGDMFERMIESFYSKVIRPGDTVIDGGAHTGRHTIPLAQLVGAHGVVVAFEPLPSAAERFRQLVEGSGLHQRIQLRKEALARAAGRCSFFVVNNMPELSGLRSRNFVGFVPGYTEISVNAVTIDSVIETFPDCRPISFVKLDLEGGEFRALQGAEKTLRTHGPCCVFENGLQSMRERLWR
jgi:FkbM family methyltransferase